MTYEDDLKPLYDVINAVFTERMENELANLFKTYKDDFLQKNNSSHLEFEKLLKTYAGITYSYLSNNYVKKILSQYYSPSGIAFLILTTISLKSKIFYSSLSGN